MIFPYISTKLPIVIHRQKKHKSENIENISIIGKFRSPILVGGAITIFKHMNVNEKDGIPYMKWKIKFMFQTTNQLLNHYDPIIVLYSNTIMIHYPIIVPSFIKFIPLWKDYPSQYIIITRILLNHDFIIVLLINHHLTIMIPLST